MQPAGGGGAYRGLRQVHENDICHTTADRQVEQTTHYVTPALQQMKPCIDGMQCEQRAAMRS